MKKSKTYGHAENHPAIQKLRMYYREYSNQGGIMYDFANSLGMSYNNIARYLRGGCEPRKATVEKWAEAFGISYDEMMTPLETFIHYPFGKYSKPKLGGKYLSKQMVRREYREGLLEDYNGLVNEGLVEYNAEIVKILEKSRI